MPLIGKIIRLMDRAFPHSTAYGHCDIPCGIYDPHDPIQAAQTVIRMTELIQELDASGADDVQSRNSMARYVAAKEEHATQAKNDLLVIWTDYFKPEHLGKYPDLHTKVWETCKLGSQAKQSVNMEAALGFRDGIKEIGDIFFETKKATA